MAPCACADRLDRGDLVLRQQPGPDVVDPDSRADGPRGGFLIAGEHHDRRQPLAPQQIDGVGGDLSRLVGDADRAKERAVARDEHG